MPSYDVKYIRTKDGYRKTVHRRHPLLFWLVAFPLALAVVLSHLWTGLALVAVLLLCAYANLKAAKGKNPRQVANTGTSAAPAAAWRDASAGPAGRVAPTASQVASPRLAPSAFLVNQSHHHRRAVG
jgi:hypothetical protein